MEVNKLSNPSRKYYTEPFELQEGEVLVDLEWTPWFISNFGRIKSKKLGTEVKGAINNCGYKFLNCRGKNKSIHRLVAEAFI